MELMRYQVIPLIAVCFFLLLLGSHAKREKDCKATSLQDMQDAAALSSLTYKTEISNGGKIPGAPGYIVQRVISMDLKHTRMNVFGEPLKAVIAKKRSPATTMIGFMGTKSLEQLMKEIGHGLRPKTRITVKGKQVEVMEYFWKAFKALKADVERIDLDPSMKYIITGHSLGGAIASVYALDMVDIKGGAIWKNPESRLITFGTPRVGDQDFADLHDELIAPFRKPRLVFKRDIVPHVPPTRRLGYYHTSREIWIEKPWWRFWRSAADWHVCPNGESKRCSNRLIIHRAKDHGMKNYLKALQKLKGDNAKLDKFMKDQCK